MTTIPWLVIALLGFAIATLGSGLSLGRLTTVGYSAPAIKVTTFVWVVSCLCTGGCLGALAFRLAVG